MRVLLVIIVFLTAGPGYAGTETFENAPGWRWAMEPVSAQFSATSVDAILVVSNRADGGAYAVTFGMTPENLGEYRAIVFDAQGNRYKPQYNYSTNNENMGLIFFRFDPQEVSFDDVEQVGLEVLPPEGRTEASRHAMARAHELGITVMPYPEPDQVYEFELTRLDGTALRSADFQGRVLLLDFWATWCAPCMQALPKIQALESAAPADRFEVVGINFDFAKEPLRQTLEEKKLTWATAHIEPGPEVMDLWFEAAGMRALPRYLVLDERGVVRLDTGDADEVVLTVKRLLGMD